MKKPLLWAILAIIVIGGIYLLAGKERGGEEEVSRLTAYTETQTFSSDTALQEPVMVPSGEAYVLEGDASLTVASDVTIDGALGCRDGSMRLEVEGKLTLNDSIICDDGDVVVVARGGLIMNQGAEVEASGNVQIVDDPTLVRTEAELDALYDTVETVPEDGQHVGPFVSENATDEGTETPSDDESSVVSFLKRVTRTAHAQVQNGTTTVNLSTEPIVVSGKIKVKTPTWKGAKRIVVFDFPNTNEVTVQDFELEGPDGRAGENDSGSCDVTGKDGEDAFRFNAYAPNLIVNNFTLTLGSGGEGGEATTGDGCETARAKGGKGGKAGNFRMIGAQKFEITGAFMVHPGDGGAGGTATAKGKDGAAGEDGGSAHATGGAGADNKKKLSVAGTVAGTSNVQFGDAVGGFGGGATAEGGAGGDGDACGVKGGNGGDATAKGGDGGDAKLTVSGGASRMDVANDIGGQGGLVEATGGVGGAGGSCEDQERGGDGGKGGDAHATEGKGGFGKYGRANDGGILDETGGDGGKGGDGCTEGKGGNGSSGDPDGEDGEDGKNTCMTITKEEDYVSLLPGEIQVIQYKDYYIPITNLQKFSDPNKQECDGGAEHWHPGPNGAINTQGMVVPDPDPNNCGFGKTSEVPIIIIDDPNYTAEAEASADAEVEGGQMIQIDPPRLIIPAQ